MEEAFFEKDYYLTLNPNTILLKAQHYALLHASCWKRTASLASWGLQWVPKYKPSRSAATSADNCRRHCGCCRICRAVDKKGNELLWKRNSPGKLGTRQPRCAPPAWRGMPRTTQELHRRVPQEGDRDHQCQAPSTDLSEMPQQKEPYPLRHYQLPPKLFEIQE